MRSIADFAEWVLGETGFEYWHQFMRSRFECMDFHHKLSDMAKQKVGRTVFTWGDAKLTDSEWDELVVELKEIFPFPIMPRMRPPNA